MIDFLKYLNKDVIGVVQSVSDVSEITTKTGKQLQKRELTLVDMSQTEVRLTLWGKQAENYQADDKAVLAFKGLRVGEFNGVANFFSLRLDPYAYVVPLFKRTISEYGQ